MNDVPPRVSPWVAAISVLLAVLVIVGPIVAGAFIIASAVGWIPNKQGPFGSTWAGVAMGLVFVLGGVAVGLRSKAGRGRAASARS